MKYRKVKILIFYRKEYDCEDRPTLKERHTTTFIIEDCYLLEFLPSLIREDIERIEVCEYDK